MEEQLKMVKLLVNAQKVKNKKVLTRQLKTKEETEKALKWMQEVKTTKSSTGRQPNIQKTPSFQQEFNKMVSGGVTSAQAQKEQAKKKQLQGICACGNPEPSFKGYCLECVQKLKQRFDSYLEKWATLKEEYENYNTQDAGKANEKLALMKAKAEQYQIKLSDV